MSTTETPQALAARLRREVNDDAARLTIKREALAEAEKAAARKTVGQRVAEKAIESRGSHHIVLWGTNGGGIHLHDFHGCTSGINVELARSFFAEQIDAACLRQREACVHAVQKAWFFGRAPLIERATYAILAAEA